MKYFYIDAQGRTCGPIDVTEFDAHGITKETPLWCQGMDNWARGGNIPALNVYFATTSPSEPRNSSTVKPEVEPVVAVKRQMSTLPPPLPKAVVGIKETPTLSSHIEEEREERFHILERIDVWKWWSLTLTFFAILGMCFSATWLALPLSILAVMRSNNALNSGVLYPTVELEKDFRKIQMYFWLGCVFFVVGVVSGVVFSISLRVL